MRWKKRETICRSATDARLLENYLILRFEGQEDDQPQKQGIKGGGPVLTKGYGVGGGIHKSGKNSESGKGTVGRQSLDYKLPFERFYNASGTSPGSGGSCWRSQ